MDSRSSSSWFLDSDITFVEINLFPASTEAVGRAHEVMQAVADSGTVIFDIRHHRGGSMDVIDTIASYLFSEPTHMVSMVSRVHDGGAVQEHISQPNDMSERFVAFIPYGRTYDPNTGEDWEGVGVLPDIEVGAADALDTALELAGSR